MISLFKKGLQELSDSNLSQGWELGVHRKPFTMYQEKHWIGTGSSGIFFFFKYSFDCAAAAHGIFSLSCSTQGLLGAACGIWFPDQGWNLGPLCWEHGVLAAGPPRKSQ